ncbi:hypothetical protein BXZ70DRAFT_960074 [Cristinia sonorae]|uniref:SPIN90/Ldb17 leucine-rich domain-containing protein n=1 Tax=Cristinia sonorae TaxID=1940300 RepID=A0A8K0UF51_9AGAR|nr:hypothetical protein BXZ70DRAFT_960074 [Cristinia sonorae]
MDAFGAVYIIENGQQFWSELEEILHVPSDCTLSRLDSALKSFIKLCSSYHEQFLQSPMQLEHACDTLLASELFTFHSERMCDLLLDDAKTTTDPHTQLIVYSILLSYGRRNSNFLRSHRRWQPILPLLMDHVRLEFDLDVDDMFIGGSASGSNSGIGPKGLVIPIEAKLRSSSLKMLYEVLRVQKLSIYDLQLFDDQFIDYLFDLVEATRDHPDEAFNYAVIKFIVALNEQFMLASLPDTPRLDGVVDEDGKRPESENRILRVLMSRLGSSMTFGENMIFMLNRANRTPEDRVMQLLVLKILYLLFTTKGTSEYFYTNDLCVLVDVFLREIVDLDESNESLRHTYLRVLHPLLTKTQLRTMPYKRPQIVHVLESLIGNSKFREINPTTKRLVQRCLGGEWCVQLRRDKLHNEDGRRNSGSNSDSMSVTSAPSASQTFTNTTSVPSDSKTKILKSSRSHENLKARHHKQQRTHSHIAEAYRHGSNDSSASLPHVASAAVQNPTLDAPAARRRDRATSVNTAVPVLERHAHVLETTSEYSQEPQDLPRISDLSISPDIQVIPVAASAIDLTDASRMGPPRARTASPRRAAPAPPVQRRKPPAIPADAAARTRHLMAASPSSLSPLSAGYRKS